MAASNKIQLGLVSDKNIRQNLQILDDRLSALEQFLGANGPAIVTSGCALYSAPQSAFGAVPGLVKSISTKMGRPVALSLQFAADPIQTCTLVNSSNGGSNGAKVAVQFTRDGKALPTIIYQVLAAGATDISLTVPPQVFNLQDAVPMGTYLYSVQAMVYDSFSTFTMQGVQLVAYET